MYAITVLSVSYYLYSFLSAKGVLADAQMFSKQTEKISLSINYIEKPQNWSEVYQFNAYTSSLLV